MYRIDWEFRPDPARLAEFLHVYAPHGDWVQLFRRAEGFIGSELSPVAGRTGWYRTTDRWATEAHHAAFLERHGAEYRALDARCERLTLEERSIGTRTELTPFHLAITVRDLAGAREFYGRLLGCPEGRSSDRWVDFDFFGHQLVCHVAPAPASGAHTPVDGQDVPVPHFGMVLEMPVFEALAARLKAAGVTFEIEPTVRFRGKPGEQATMFLRDPSGNALEFKSFRDIAGQLFAK